MQSNCYDEVRRDQLAAAASPMPTPPPRATSPSSTARTAPRSWAYKGWPLYLWIKDTKPGDTTGDGVGGVWHTAVAAD